MTGVLQPWKSSEMILTDGRSGRLRIRSVWIGLILGVVLLQWLARSDAFPALWDTVFSDPIDALRALGSSQSPDPSRLHRVLHPDSPPPSSGD